MIKYAALALMIICSIDSSLVYAGGNSSKPKNPDDSSQSSGMSIHEAKNTGEADSGLEHKKESKKKELKNPLPFRPPSFYLKELTEEEKKNKLKVKKHEEEEKQDLKNAYRGGKVEARLPDALATKCAEFLTPPQACLAVARKNLPNKKQLFLNELARQFVKIPAGFLPPEDSKKEKIPVEAFETTRYPVTRAFWQEVMGDMPPHVPKEEKAAWNQCPDCPVTHVAYEEYDLDEKGERKKDKDGKDLIKAAEIQEFLKKLNEKVEGTGCHYDLPTSAQLKYTQRGDVTGENKDKYSKGVTDTNVDEYVTYYGNSNKPGPKVRQIQPVGHKKLNEFGIELGNVWKISKDMYDPAHSEWGRAACGGSWYSSASYASSGRRFDAGVGDRGSNDGFALLRTCP